MGMYVPHAPSATRRESKQVFVIVTLWLTDAQNAEWDVSRLVPFAPMKYAFRQLPEAYVPPFGVKIGLFALRNVGVSDSENAPVDRRSRLFLCWGLKDGGSRGVLDL